MTPLTLNLLAEEQQAEAASARDPVKIAIAIGVMILALTAGGGMMMMMWAEQKKSEADRVQKRWETVTAKQTGGTFRSLRLLAEDLVGIHQRRMLLAPQVAKIKDLVPDSIYVTRLSFKMSVEAGTTPAVASAEGGGPRAARPQNVDRLTLRLDGAAIGTRPEIEVDKFLQTLRTAPVLSNQVKEITLRSIGRAPLAGDADAQKLVAQFVIECIYKECK